MAHCASSSNTLSNQFPDWPVSEDAISPHRFKHQPLEERELVIRSCVPQLPLPMCCLLLLMMQARALRLPDAVQNLPPN